MKKIVSMSCVIVSMVLFSMGVSFAGTVTQWEMVYDHDSFGVALNGTNINNLKTAILNGSDVKVIFHSPGIYQSVKLSRVRLETSLDGASVVSVVGFYDETAPTSTTQFLTNWFTNGLYDNSGGVLPRLYSYSTTGQLVTYYPTNTPATNNIQILTMPMTWYVSK